MLSVLTVSSIDENSFYISFIFGYQFVCDSPQICMVGTKEKNNCSFTQNLRSESIQVIIITYFPLFTRSISLATRFSHYQYHFLPAVHTNNITCYPLLTLSISLAIYGSHHNITCNQLFTLSISLTTRC